MEEVERIGRKLEPYTSPLEAQEPHENRFSHVLDYIRQRVSREQTQADDSKGTAVGDGPRLVDSEVEAAPATPLRQSISSEIRSKQEQGDDSQ